MATQQILTIAVSDGSPLNADHVAEAVHQMIPGSHTLDNVSLDDADLTFFEWDGSEQDVSSVLPLRPEQARELLDASDEDGGRLSVVITVDQQDYLDGYARSTRDVDGDHFDLLHETCFGFGLPHGCEARILAVSGQDFVVLYTTDVAAALAQHEED